MKWELKSLSDCCLSIADGDHQAPPKSDSGIPFVTISDIDANNQFDFSNTMFVPQSYYDSLDSKRKAQIGDVLYSVVGSFGIPVYIKENTPFAFQRHIAILRPNDTVLPRFLYYNMLCRDFYARADAIALGAAQRTITLTALRNMKILVPPMEVQERIVNILSAYDDLIENNQKQIKLLEEAAQRLYKEWFIDLRFPGHETISVTNGFPDGWKVRSMNDISEYINGYAFKPTDWGTVGKPIIKIKEMGVGVTADTPRNTGEDIPEKYNVAAGDILFSWSATLSTMIWDEEDGLLNQHLFKVIPYDGISREFVLQSILKTLGEFSNLTTGSTMKHIQRGKLKEVKVNVPNAELMEQYKSISEPIREQILNIKRQMILLHEARDRLLPKLMSGELEV